MFYTKQYIDLHLVFHKKVYGPITIFHNIPGLTCTTFTNLKFPFHNWKLGALRPNLQKKYLKTQPMFHKKKLIIHIWQTKIFTKTQHTFYERNDNGLSALFIKVNGFGAYYVSQLKTHRFTAHVSLYSTVLQPTFKKKRPTKLNGLTL